MHQTEHLVVHLQNEIERMNIETHAPNDRIEEWEEEIKQSGNMKHKSYSRTTLLHLPPEVIEEVFTYLSIQEIYHNVRNVCGRLCDIGDGYVQTGKQAK